MSSIRNAIPRRAHKERAQPEARKKFGLLEKHKDYVVRAKSFHRKEETLRILREKAEFRNPDEFNFKMINSKLQDGVHKPKHGIEFTHEEQMLMKSKDANCILHLLQIQKKKIDKLTATLHLLDSVESKNKHVYFAEDREEAKELKQRVSNTDKAAVSIEVPPNIKRKTESSYRELEDRKTKVQDLERMYNKLIMQKELHKKGRKRKLREDEIVNPTSIPVYKWRSERKR